MPIDISREQPIPFTQAAAHVPRRRQGRKTSVATLYRWSTRGLHGIQLESIQVGGTRCTSLGALQRFFDRLSSLASSQGVATRKDSDAQERSEQAARQLDEIWETANKKARTGRGLCKQKA
jgi:hypothetical protein